MINLKEICDQNLDLLAGNHFDNLNPTDINGYLVEDSLIMKLINYQESIEDQNEKDIITFLLGTNFNQIYTLISGSPEELNSIINDFEANYDTSLISINRGKTAELTSFGNDLKKIFDYETYRSSQTCRSEEHTSELQSRPHLVC